MTQFAAWISCDRTLVGVDSRVTPLQLDPASPLGRQFAHETAMVGGRIVETSKVLALLHARLLLAHAGGLSFLSAVFLACQTQIGADDFDALDAKMPGILGGAFESLLGQHRAYYPEVPVEAIRGQLLLMVGWSAARGRVCAAIFNETDEPPRDQRGLALLPDLPPPLPLL